MSESSQFDIPPEEDQLNEGTPSDKRKGWIIAAVVVIGLLLDRVMAAVGDHSKIASNIIYGVTAVLALTAAALSLRDGLRARAGRLDELTLGLPDFLKSRIRLTISKRARLGLTVRTTLVLGGLVALYELPCTGQVYIVVIAALRHLPEHSWGAAGWLLLYNLFFILPLVAVFVAVYFGLSSGRLTTAFKRHLATTKFALAVIFAILGGYMLTLVGPVAWRYVTRLF